MSKVTTRRRVQIDYHPHRINSTSSAPASVAPDAGEVLIRSIGESYDLGEVITFDSVEISTDESESRQTFA